MFVPDMTCAQNLRITTCPAPVIATLDLVPFCSFPCKETVLPCLFWEGPWFQWLVPPDPLHIPTIITPLLLIIKNEHAPACFAHSSICVARSECCTPQSAYLESAKTQDDKHLGILYGYSW